ncbi:MAG: HAD family hydrolase [Cypionkella sp.]|uniref:HAD family hydrolase n=1 Tax=Cypionkella sp. TaxID=2811411 RepID=UPI002AB8D44C|nr:HAD family hydrolase [Cypionkella sp.]MDZ4309353.1 HAD family hydrolase [Cypionkella sp.]MDZ4395279.1 HAD family hydrolase [Cypionkella sp.]
MIEALIFDKDGTLFDFRLSWGAWTKGLLSELGDADGLLASVLGYDALRNDFAPDSPVIAMTTPEIADILLPHLPGMRLEELLAMMNQLAADAPMVPAVDLPAVLGALRARGLKLGLATNDTEVPARRHLDGAGVLGLFDFVAGCDSGFGGKPAPGQLLAFVQHCGLTPGRVAMVGDSLHDLDAGRAAGMKAVAVLTGIAVAADLEAHADVVLTNISELAAWIDGLAAA